MSQHYGWTPAECADLTLVQLAAYLVANDTLDDRRLLPAAEARRLQQRVRGERQSARQAWIETIMQQVKR